MTARITGRLIHAQEHILLSEVIGALSYALDLTEGQPPGHCLRSCWIGVHVGKTLGLDTEHLWDLYYTLLLKDAGCSSNAARLCELYGYDDHTTKRDFKLVDSQRLVEITSFVLRHTALGKQLGERIRHIMHLAKHGEQLATELIMTRCERGAEIAQQLGFNDRIANGIRCLDEHWNGKGRPFRISGAAIPLNSRIALLSQVADVFHSIGGPQRALAEVAGRSHTWFDPEVVRAFESAGRFGALWETLKSPELEARVADLEPASKGMIVDDDYLDAISSAFGRVVDAKSPYTYGHSTRVAEYSSLIAQHLGLSPERRRWLRRGAFLHDLGKLGVSNSILDKPSGLTAEEWSAVKRHPQHTEEILMRLSPFAELALVAGAHHERLDGKGYPRGLPADQIRLETRIITLCDIFDALTADRPYRAAIPVEESIEIMQRQRGIAIDNDCLDALLHAVPTIGLLKD
ncbi:MAG: HD domain-containing protein [Gammaproteobacteria bacterium]|nr:HD domain-containing protein [Gammaproteobacteria bacterium]